MTTTYYEVTGSATDPGNFTASSGTLASCVDDPPDTPDTGDYGSHTGVPMFEPVIELNIEPPTFGDSDALRIRLYCGTVETADPPRSQITDASLIDDADAVAATLSANVNVPVTGGLIELVMTHGGPSSSYDFSTARIQMTFTLLNATEIRVFAVDFAVTADEEDPNTEGPGGQRAAHASHHQTLCSF